MKDNYGLYIGGKFVPSISGETFVSIDPSDGEPLYRAAAGSAADVDSAVQEAARAFHHSAWAGLTPTKRGHLLRRFGDLLGEHAEELAKIEAQDSGRLLVEMRAQMSVLPAYYHYYGGLADKIHGDVIPPYVNGTLAYTLREPLGVVGGIVPWNAPLSLAALKIAPALAAGNTIVIKPSEHTSASLLETMALAEEAGVPPGVINVVTGMGEAGAALAAHPLVAKLSFTGGSETGRKVAHAAVDHFAGLTLELGGKSPQIIFSDADPQQVADGLVNGVFGAAGQACVAGSRAFIHAEIYDEVVDVIVRRARELVIGHPMASDTQVGPLCFEAHRNRVERFVASGLEEGATLLAGGSRPKHLASGWYYEPTIFTNVTPDMTITKEEIFGPVLGFSRFETESEAVALANDTRFGLAAGLWTRDVARAHRMAAQLDAGTVWVNQYRASTPLTPMGGFKQSGWGKEGGLPGIDEYLRLKVVSISLAPASSGRQFRTSQPGAARG